MLACCAYALIACGQHWVACRSASLSELLGHPLHAVSMIYMLLVMLRLTPAFINSSFWMQCFLLCAVLFGVRTLRSRAGARRCNEIDALFSLIMVYMWMSPLKWTPALTAGVCLVCFGRACLNLSRMSTFASAASRTQKDASMFLNSSGQVALLVTMGAMFMTMQP